MSGSINIGQQGLLRSTPTKVLVKADDNYRIVYRNVGKNKYIPLMWSTNHIMDGGADTVVASGISMYGLELALYSSFAVTVVSGTQDGYVYINKDVENNVITLMSTGSNTVGVDITWLLGADPTVALL
jgi:hypothetical protein